MPRRLPLFVVALVLILATGCQVRLAAGVDVARDGSGRVRAGVGLDAEALAEIGDPATALRLDDLRQAGWEVESPRKEGDGLTWMRASKPFANPAQADAALAELSGPGGPFRDLKLTRTTSRLRSRTTFTGVVDLAGGLSGLSDADLAGRLGDVDLGLSLDGLRTRFGEQLATAVKVDVSTLLPGKVKTNAPVRDGERANWSPALGETVLMEASSTAFRVDPAAVGTGAAVVGTLLISSIILIRRRRHRTHRTQRARRATKNRRPVARRR